MPAALQVHSIFVLLKTSLCCWVIFKTVKIQGCKVRYLLIAGGHRTGEVNLFPASWCSIPCEREGGVFYLWDHLFSQSSTLPWKPVLIIWRNNGSEFTQDVWIETFCEVVFSLFCNSTTFLWVLTYVPLCNSELVFYMASSKSRILVLTLSVLFLICTNIWWKFLNTCEVRICHTS